MSKELDEEKREEKYLDDCKSRALAEIAYLYEVGAFRRLREIRDRVRMALDRIAEEALGREVDWELLDYDTLMEFHEYFSRFEEELFDPDYGGDYGGGDVYPRM